MTTKEHEIGNILGVLIGNAQLLAGEDLGADAKDMAQDILDASLRLKALLLPGSPDRVT